MIAFPETRSLWHFNKFSPVIYHWHSQNLESSPVQEGRAGEPEIGSFCNVVNRRKSLVLACLSLRTEIIHVWREISRSKISRFGNLELVLCSNSFLLEQKKKSAILKPVFLWVILNREMAEFLLTWCRTQQTCHRQSLIHTQQHPQGFLENPSSTEIALSGTLHGLFKGRWPRQTSLLTGS